MNLKADTRIGLQKAPAGQSPRIEHFCIKVRPFDREAVTAGLKRISASHVMEDYLQPELFLRYLQEAATPLEVR